MLGARCYSDIALLQKSPWCLFYKSYIILLNLRIFCKALCRTHIIAHVPGQGHTLRSKTLMGLPEVLVLNLVLLLILKLLKTLNNK